VRVAENPSALRINPQYTIFHIEKNNALLRSFKELIELRFLSDLRGCQA